MSTAFKHCILTVLSTNVYNFKAIWVKNTNEQNLLVFFKALAFQLMYGNEIFKQNLVCFLIERPIFLAFYIFKQNSIN